MSVLKHPQRQYVAQLKEYVHSTLWGNTSDRSAHNTVQFDNYGVRASLFYAGKAGYRYSVDTWGSWPQGRSETTWRSYNYPHVTVVYWALYRLAHSPQLPRS